MAARLVDRPEQFFKRQLSAESRVLLINPPVHERRYHWIRWNQPLELLKLSAWLKQTYPGIDVRLFDFMFPDENGEVPKHKMKATWTSAPDAPQLWHFGTPLREFGEKLATWLRSSRWLPDCIVVTSLTSYWHASIKDLLNTICSQLGGQAARKRTKLVLYGNYPRFEPEHAETQDADVALRSTVAAPRLMPDFALYKQDYGRLPAFFALDVEDPDVGEHLTACVGLNASAAREKSQRVRPITVAFFNEDLFSERSQIHRVQEFTSAHPGSVQFEGIVGVRPESLTAARIELLGEVGFRSLYVEHARLPGGDVDMDAYQPLIAAALRADHAKKTGAAKSNWLEKGGGADHGGLTAFVNIGLPDDDMDKLVRSTLLLNKAFQSIILKPFGYSPDIDPATVEERRSRWRQPSMSSPQWFPYAGGSNLTREEYDDLMSWQNLLNRRVKGTTFDFLDDGVIAKLVRETLVAESWKPGVEAR